MTRNMVCAPSRATISMPRSQQHQLFAQHQTFNAFYNYEFQERSVGGINPTGGSSPDATAGSANLYPLANA